MCIKSENTIIAKAAAVFSFLVMSWTAVHSQAVPSVQWTQWYGLSGYDEAKSIACSRDDGYILAGSTNSTGQGAFDVILIKFTQSGNLQWQKTFGGTANDEANSVLQAADGGYVICGGTRSYGVATHSGYVIKTDKLGNQLWSRILEDANSYLNSMVQTSDGGFVAAGYVIRPSYNNNAFLVKLDSLGNVLWTREFDSGLKEECNSVIETSDGGFILAGTVYSLDSWGSFTSHRMHLIKTDSLGNFNWSKDYSGSSRECFANAIQETTDGGFIVGGGITNELYPSLSVYDIYLLKINSSGNTVWSRTFDGFSYSTDNVCYSLFQTADGGYFIAGTKSIYELDPQPMTGIESRYSFLTSHSTYVIKTDSTGTKQWSKDFSEGNSICVAATIAHDGGFVMAGKRFIHLNPKTNYNIYLHKLSPEKTVATTIEPNIVHRGENILIKLRLNNTWNRQVTGRFYTEYILPNGTRIPLIQSSDTTWHFLAHVTISEDQSLTHGIRASIPGYFSPGVYTYKSYFRVDGDSTIYTDETIMRVTGQ